MMGCAPGPDDLIVPLPPDAAERRYKRKGEPFRTTYYSGKCWRKYDLPALGWRHRRHYDMRATFITLAIDDGADPDVLELPSRRQGRLGRFRNARRLGRKRGIEAGPWAASGATFAHAAIYRALRTEDVSALLPFSGAVAQAAAQLLASAGRPVHCERTSWPPELEFAWAVLRISGVDFRVGASSPPSKSPIIRLATGEPENRETVADLDDYYREVFSLRGQRQPRVSPRALLLDAFDADEAPVFDALDLLRMSS